jgi:hypothetical protein
MKQQMQDMSSEQIAQLMEDIIRESKESLEHDVGDYGLYNVASFVMMSFMVAAWVMSIKAMG